MHSVGQAPRSSSAAGWAARVPSSDSPVGPKYEVASVLSGLGGQMGERGRVRGDAGLRVPDRSTQRGQLELSSGALSQVAAGHLAALTAQAAQAPTAMIHLLEGEQLRLVGSSGLPAEWASAAAVPVSSTLGGLVLAEGLPVVITEVASDARVPASAPGRAVGERAYVGFPIRDGQDHVAGVCAVLDYQPRSWDTRQLAAVDEGAQACTAFVIEQLSHARADHARRLLDALLDSLQSGVAACDADGRLVFSNAANRQLNGVLPANVDLRTWTRRRVAESPATPLPPAAQPLVRALDGEHLREVEVTLERPGERPSVFLADAQPIRDATGEALGAVVALQDVTHAHSTALLKDCELTVRRILSGTDTGPLHLVLTEAIAAIGQMLGWAATEFWNVDQVGNVLRRELSWTDAGHAQPSNLPAQLRYGEGMPGVAWQTSEAVWAEDLNTDPNARAQTLEWGALRSAVTVPVPIGSITRGVLTCYSVYPESADDVRTTVMTGIAAHIGQFLERHRAGTLAAELDRSRDEYIALVGHEIRTPLTSIGAYTDLMLDGDDLPADDRLMMLQVLRRNVAGLHTIIDKLLDIAGMQAGRISVAPHEMDLCAVVRASATHDHTHATLRLDIPDHAILWGDPARLTQVVNELLANAFTWVDDNGSVTVTVTTDGPITQLSVSNTGSVIPAAERDRLFDRFFRTASAGQRAIPGTGLGLSLARTIVERHGGTITAICDETRHDTTLTVRLPTQAPAPAGPDTAA
ncbi:MAG TPA: PAS domain-containing sensor histidine kinase [Pilimelia sp.]|nr:PAS domain-containing sensor histidine kinase [Pilimelia sp.]